MTSTAPAAISVAFTLQERLSAGSGHATLGAEMAILSEQVREQLRQRFAERLQDPVELQLYTKPGTGRLILPSGLGCATCDDARQLIEAVADAAPDKLSLVVTDVSAEPVTDVEEVPLLTIGKAAQPHRIRFLGLPAGFEFATVIDAIERVSRSELGLSEKTLERLAALEQAVDVMIFATPT
jgi:alkyl hydroperoxide reductase subunit AhpF